MSVLFVDLVRERFEFLISEKGFGGPEVLPGWVIYHSANLSIEVGYDDRASYVTTFACARVGERTLRAELSCLNARAGLGPAQEVGWAAGTSHAMTKSLDSQAHVTRRILDVLVGEKRDYLLASCHGR